MKCVQATYRPAIVEFYFDNARTIMDLTVSRTIQNFTKIRYHIPHGGDSFPSIEDRFLKSFPALELSSKEIYNTRCVPVDQQRDLLLPRTNAKPSGSGGIAQVQYIQTRSKVCSRMAFKQVDWYSGR